MATVTESSWARLAASGGGAGDGRRGRRWAWPAAAEGGAGRRWWEVHDDGLKEAKVATTLMWWRDEAERTPTVRLTGKRESKLSEEALAAALDPGGKVALGWASSGGRWGRSGGRPQRPWIPAARSRSAIDGLLASSRHGVDRTVDGTARSRSAGRRAPELAPEFDGSSLRWKKVKAAERRSLWHGDLASDSASVDSDSIDSAYADSSSTSADSASTGDSASTMPGVEYGPVNEKWAVDGARLAQEPKWRGGMRCGLAEVAGGLGHQLGGAVPGHAGYRFRRASGRPFWPGPFGHL
uniref:Uncharacterized protein n=1 Tax=Oryza sativa subsp. japonica TaxID=39947 RepID=Q84SQ9_ORYSJ|nr:hypothetical protein [Oryza sativa Japonica Group]